MFAYYIDIEYMIENYIFVKLFFISRADWSSRAWSHVFAYHADLEYIVQNYIFEALYFISWADWLTRAWSYVLDLEYMIQNQSL